MITNSAWWPPSNSGEWAAWVQAFGVVGTVLGGAIWNGWLARARVTDRRAEAERAGRVQPGRVLAWAALPRNEARGSTTPQSGPPDAPIQPEPGAWVIDGHVANHSDEMIFDLVIDLATPQGAKIQTPAFSRRFLPPREEWPISWYMRRTVTGYASSGSVIGQTPLPAPACVLNPAARPSLRLHFTDSTGQRWSRIGGQLHRTDDAMMVVSETEALLSRALEIMRDTHEAEGARGNLLEAINVAVRDVTQQSNMLYSNADVFLAENQQDFQVSADYTEAGNAYGVYAIAGALRELTEFETVKTSTGETSQQRAYQLSVAELYLRTLAILTALNSLKQATPTSPSKSNTLRGPL